MGEEAGDEPVFSNEKIADAAHEPQQVFEPEKALKPPIQPGQTIYITNAGLVLTVPFLPRLFENLGVVDNKKLNSPELAVAIMNYIVARPGSLC